MAGFFLKSVEFCSASSSSWTHFCNSHCLVLVLTLLSFSLAVLAYALQWRGDFIGIAELLPEDDEQFPGMRQEKPSSVPLYSSPSVKVLSRSLPRSLVSHGNWNLTYRQDLKPKICITVTTSAGLDQILPWIFFHKVIGVTAFYIFVEGTAASPEVSEVLESIIGVNVIRRTRELEEQQANSRIWNETWLERFFYKPCNHELFVKQTLNMEMSIVMAKDAGMDWIIHVDTDELIHPAGTSGYSIRELLSKVPRNIDVIVFPNYESLVEKDDVKEPFEEVSLFKKNYDHIPKDIFFENYEEASHGNPNFFLTYANGKSAARIQDHLRPNGAHRWHNYVTMPLQAKTEEVALLHYTYAKFSDLTSRRDRCACKPVQEVVRRCFILEFDRAAFMVASTGTEEEMRLWFSEHIVWNDTAQILRFLRRGIFARIYTPMVIIGGLKESGLFHAMISSAARSSTMNEFSHTMLVNSSMASANYASNKDESRGLRRRVLRVDTLESRAVPPLSSPATHFFNYT